MGALLSPCTSARERSVKMLGQCRGPRSMRCRQCPHHDPGALGKPVDAIAHQVTQLALHAIAIDCRADGLAHDETDGRVSAGSRNAGSEHNMCDEGWLNALGSTTDRVPEILPAAHALTAREQRIRRRAWRDPCGGDPRGSRDPRGCAYEGGSRASWHDDGCSAGKYACSRCLSLLRCAVSRIAGRWAVRRPPLAHDQKLIMDMRQKSCRDD